MRRTWLSRTGRAARGAGFGPESVATLGKDSSSGPVLKLPQQSRRDLEETTMFCMQACKFELHLPFRPGKASAALPTGTAHAQRPGGSPL
ncbi:hypothetical protein AGOR_G00228400 [Albula goreensis]|uniref:Uncharacterized protein n=1 Tax=Albula goreensis TaxID=1534307 RepID=A0A8T3CN71_9TELE|nr:hypothetical protein AGOR_G00228400 [Albula goreensis]